MRALIALLLAVSPVLADGPIVVRRTPTSALTCGAANRVDEDFDGGAASPTGGITTDGNEDVAWAGNLNGYTVDMSTSALSDTWFEGDEAAFATTGTSTMEAEVTTDLGSAYTALWVALSFKVTSTAGLADGDILQLAQVCEDTCTPGGDDGMALRLIWVAANSTFTSYVFEGTEFSRCGGGSITGLVANNVYVAQFSGDTVGSTCTYKLWDCGSTGAACTLAYNASGAQKPDFAMQDAGFGQLKGFTNKANAFSIGFFKIDSSAAPCN